MDNKFKDILKELRKEKELSHFQLAKKIGVSKAIVGFWENGLREPTMSSLIALADYFNVSIDYLVGREL